jgi:hypothetical protein
MTGSLLLGLNSLRSDGGEFFCCAGGRGRFPGGVHATSSADGLWSTGRGIEPKIFCETDLFSSGFHIVRNQKW